MIHQPTKRRDALNPRYIFRDARTGKFVSRIFALFNPQFTIRERRW